VLLVRALQASDIEAAFPVAKTRVEASADYLHRAVVPADEVAQSLAGRVRGIRYGNFKDCMSDCGRHDAYWRVWGEMAQWGQRAAP
jgi:hypothetical protein